MRRDTATTDTQQAPLALLLMAIATVLIVGAGSGVALWQHAGGAAAKTVHVAATPTPPR